MTIIKLLGPNTPDKVLDDVKAKAPKSVLVLWIDDNGEVAIHMDDSVTMQNLAYYNKALDIWTENILVNGSY